ncbi:hypothetical protein ACFQY0_01245 [Haloferula chungangensis]|uniref:Uncharacterized protein n=1 Tax=Haloferula chungangensis TaxID=1048331 RepID=A0ABW2L2J3_9BACT
MTKRKSKRVSIPLGVCLNTNDRRREISFFEHMVELQQDSGAGDELRGEIDSSNAAHGVAVAIRILESLVGHALPLPRVVKTQDAL